MLSLLKLSETSAEQRAEDRSFIGSRSEPPFAHQKLREANRLSIPRDVSDLVNLNAQPFSESQSRSAVLV